MITDVTQIKEGEYYAELNRVSEEYIKGTIDATTISKVTGIRRDKVVKYISEFQAFARSRKYIQERATESLTSMDMQLSMVQKELWSIIENDNPTPNVKNSVLKNIADVEVKRHEVLQRAGVFNEDSLPEELVALQEKVDVVQKILLEVARKYPDTKTFIMDALSKANSGEAPPAVVDERSTEMEIIKKK